MLSILTMVPGRFSEIPIQFCQTNWSQDDGLLQLLPITDFKLQLDTLFLTLRNRANQGDMPRTTDSQFLQQDAQTYLNEWDKCANRTTFQLFWNCKHTHIIYNKRCKLQVTKFLIMYLHVDKIISLSEVQILSSVDCETLLAVRLLKR